LIGSGAPIAIYAFNVGGGLSSIPDHWGDFGSYLSGTTSTFIGSLSFIAILITINLQMRDSRFNTFSQKRRGYLDNIDLLIRELEERYKYSIQQDKAKISVSSFGLKVSDKGTLSAESKLLLEKETVDMEVASLKRKAIFVEMVTEYTTLMLDISNPRVKTDEELDLIYLDGRDKIHDKEVADKI